MNLLRVALLRVALLAGALLPHPAAAQAVAANAAAPRAAGAQASRSALAPDTVLAPTGGPRIVLLTSPGEGVAALRLAVPLREGPAEAGAGMLLQDLALERMRSLARPVGAKVGAARTPWGLAYSVVGAEADFEYLAYLLREAVAPPDVEGPAFQEARLRLLGEAAEAVETPARRVAAELRAQVAPDLPPLAGTPASVQALGGARVREVWMRTHQASAMTLLVSAPVAPEVVLAATRGMGAPEEGVAPPLDAPLAAPRAPEPQTLRSWYGEAWTASAPGDPGNLVIASLVADHLRKNPQGTQASVELWELPGRAVLAVIGSALGRDAAALRRTVSGALAAVRSSLDAQSVAAAVAAVRRDLLLESRTSAGLVALVGRALDAEGDPWAAERQREALLSLDEGAVRALLDALLRQAPRSAHVRP